MKKIQNNGISTSTMVQLHGLIVSLFNGISTLIVLYRGKEEILSEIELIIN